MLVTYKLQIERNEIDNNIFQKLFLRGSFESSRKMKTKEMKVARREPFYDSKFFDFRLGKVIISKRERSNDSRTRSSSTLERRAFRTVGLARTFRPRHGRLVRHEFPRLTGITFYTDSFSGWSAAKNLTHFIFDTQDWSYRAHARSSYFTLARVAAFSSALRIRKKPQFK